MSKKAAAGKSLSALVFCLGAGQAVNAETIKIQALKLLQEQRISYEEFQAMIKVQSGGVDSSYISSGNYASYISSGNYANYISDGNYADYISAGNYANYISDGNYGMASLDESELVPQPAQQNK